MDISINVDECSSEINKHLISRRDDPHQTPCQRHILLSRTFQDMFKKKSQIEVYQLNKLTINLGENSVNKEALAVERHK